MRAADLTTALLLMAGGILVISDSLRLGIGWSTDGPKSGFFPFWLGVILLACCLAVVTQAVRRADRTRFVTREAVGPVLKVLVPATLFVVLIQAIGLYVASALYMGLYMRWIGRHSWLAVVALSVGFAVVTYAVFEIWFLVPMPKGPLEAWLGY
jgi:putative tricarboxylic transport membrane protein